MPRSLTMALGGKRTKEPLFKWRVVFHFQFWIRHQTSTFFFFHYYYYSEYHLRIISDLLFVNHS